MISYIWPIALVVLSNVFYHICAKCMPEDVNPFICLLVTYIVSMTASVIMFFVTDRDGSLIAEIKKVNWAPFVLGLVIIRLEVGNIYTYKAGWPISIASIVQNSFLAIVLLVVGLTVFREALTWNKVAGIIICMVGLIFINLK